MKTKAAKGTPMEIILEASGRDLDRLRNDYRFQVRLRKQMKSMGLPRMSSLERKSFATPAEVEGEREAWGLQAGSNKGRNNKAA